MIPQEKLQNIEDSLNEYGQGCITSAVTRCMIARIRALEAALEKIIQDDTCEYTLETARKALESES